MSSIKKSYDKPSLAFEQLIELLKKRGMVIDDEKQAIDELASIGYYRLSAYSYPFRKYEKNSITDNFVANTNWQKVIDIYHFDKELRLLVMEAIEWVEIMLRTQIAHLFSQKYTEFGHLDKGNFHNKFKHKKLIEHIQREESRSKSAAVKHFKDNYKEPHIPMRILIEEMSFGSLSRFYSGLKIKDRKKISKYFNASHETLKLWLHTFVYVRNICAHHNRLWNTTLHIHPKKLDDFQLPNNRVFIVLMILSKLLTIPKKQEAWEGKIYKLIDEITQKYPDEERIFEMLGMVENKVCNKLK